MLKRGWAQESWQKFLARLELEHIAKLTYLDIVSQVFLPVSIREGAEIPSAPGTIRGAVGGTAFGPRRC